MRASRLAVSAWRLPGIERRRVVEAATALARASLALNVLPFARAIRFGAVDLPPSDAADTARIREWVRAVRRASYALPWRNVCIHQGLALQRLLRRRGVPAVLCYGTSQTSGELKAHVWVKVGDEIVIGGEEAPHYHLVATYPPESPGLGAARKLRDSAVL